MSALNALLHTTFATTRGSISLQAMLAEKNLTIFLSYPGDFTSVCTKQMCSYADHAVWERLAQLPCTFWGISRDDIASHKKFAEKTHVPFALISDPRAALLDALGLHGLLGTRRGLTGVSRNATIVGTFTMLPFFYPTAKDIEHQTREWLGRL